MKIVQLITRPQRRGAEIFAVQLAEELIKLGHQVWVISIFNGDGGLSFSNGIIELNIGNNNKLDWNGFLKLATELKKIEPDIIQANASDTLRFGVAAKYFYKKHFKLIYRNANTISSFIKGRGHFIFNKFLHSHVDGVVSVSDHSMLDYVKLFEPKFIQTIPIGIDTFEIDLKLKSEDFDFDKEYLLFVGSLVSEKDPLGMLEIFKDVLKNHPNLQLIFLGSGPLKEELLLKIDDMDLNDSVTLIPNKENIFPILVKAKGLVMPSKIEGLPGVILEAMYCKVPVIAFGVGGIPEVLNEKTGWLVSPGHLKDFSNTLKLMLEFPNKEIQKLTFTAKEVTLKKFSIKQIARDFEILFQRFTVIMK